MAGEGALSARKRAATFAFPLAMLSVLGLLSFGLTSTPLSRIVPVAYVIEAVMTGPVIFAINTLGKHKWSLSWALTSLSVQSLLILSIFASIYRAAGLAGAPSPLGFADAMYFSIVTWTTLGYGDFKPLADLRLFAAIEAIYGYMFLGIIVGLVSGLFDRRGA